MTITTKHHTQAAQTIARRTTRKGATVVEVAVVLPIVFLIFFAGMEFSQANALRHTSEAAAYEGARRAIIPGAKVSDAQQSAQSLLGAVAVRGATVTVEPATILPETKRVTVKVSIPFNQNSVLASRFLRRAVFSSSCTLNREVMD
jgi:Flp pilus assembly protein TadG